MLIKALEYILVLQLIYHFIASSVGVRSFRETFRAVTKGYILVLYSYVQFYVYICKY